MASSFIESEWIGLGKEYDIIKIPEDVSEAKKQLFKLKMPDAVEATIPHNTMPLRDFLACKLPTKSSEFIPIKDASLFSKKLPCGLEVNAETLMKCAIPSDQHLQTTPTGLYLSELDSALFYSLNRLSPLLKKAAEDFKKRSTKDSELV